MFVWVVAICMIYNFITSKTAFGRYFYAIGGNEKATQLSGIDTNKVYFIAYANMGLLAGLAGLLCAARVGSVNGSTGTSFEMDAIGSCFIGGASAYGGSGTVGLSLIHICNRCPDYPLYGRSDPCQQGLCDGWWKCGNAGNSKRNFFPGRDLSLIHISGSLLVIPQTISSETFLITIFPTSHFRQVPVPALHSYFPQT